MLTDNNICDILISIVLINALLSIVVSTILEGWNQERKARAKFLKQVIYLLLEDPLKSQSSKVPAATCLVKHISCV